MGSEIFEFRPLGAKKVGFNGSEERLILAFFQTSLQGLQTSFSLLPVVKIPKFQCPLAREFPEVFKSHQTYISRANFEGVIAISKIKVFFSCSENIHFQFQLIIFKLNFLWPKMINLDMQGVFLKQNSKLFPLAPIPRLYNA